MDAIVERGLAGLRAADAGGPARHEPGPHPLLLRLQTAAPGAGAAPEH